MRETRKHAAIGPNDGEPQPCNSTIYPERTNVSHQPLKIVIGIATAGRREQLALTLQQLAGQTLPPTKVLVCPAAPEDFDDSALPDVGAPILRVMGSRGSCAQRNAMFAHAAACDVLLFIDDDYYPAVDYLERLAEVFVRSADVAIVTSNPVYDGANGPGLTHEFAVEALRRRGNQITSTEPSELVDTYGGYGCNLSVRLSTVFAHNLRFDENLPLYGWLEDIDFSRRVAAHGRVVACHSLYGVHLGTKRGKSSGVRLGYSQVANPVYMMRKGSVSSAYALNQILRNVLKNAARLFNAEPWVDRRGRSKGNLMALRDLLQGRADPRRILDL